MAFLKVLNADSLTFTTVRDAFLFPNIFQMLDYYPFIVPSVPPLNDSQSQAHRVTLTDTVSQCIVIRVEHSQSVVQFHCYTVTGTA